MKEIVAATILIVMGIHLLLSLGTDGKFYSIARLLDVTKTLLQVLGMLVVVATMIMIPVWAITVLTGQ